MRNNGYKSAAQIFIAILQGLIMVHGLRHNDMFVVLYGALLALVNVIVNEIDV